VDFEAVVAAEDIPAVVAKDVVAVVVDLAVAVTVEEVDEEVEEAEAGSR